MDGYKVQRGRKRKGGRSIKRTSYKEREGEEAQETKDRLKGSGGEEEKDR